VRFTSEGFYALGKVVVIDHLDRTATWYGHNDRIQVKNGDMVDRGDVIAMTGSTGRVSEPCLHFRMVRLPTGTPYDPLPMLPSPRTNR
jgi:murein DD-endopeptidase MepM/ murein hydrolase activator NlpD